MALVLDVEGITPSSILEISSSMPSALGAILMLMSQGSMPFERDKQLNTISLGTFKILCDGF